jgi:hypothetical protein
MMDSIVGGVELLVRSGGRMMWYLSREKYKEVFYDLLLYPIDVSNVSIFSVASEICVGPHN